MKHVSPEPTGPDETVLYAADRVRTLMPEQPLAEAMVTRGGKVVAVGGRRELQAAHPGVRVVEVRGATIVPGLADAHAHLAGLGRTLSILNFAGTSSVEQILELAKTAPPASYEGEWLVGRGWDQNTWPKGQSDFPTRQQLDALFPSTPVYFTRVDGHAAWVNTEALRRSGVGATTPDPPGGRIIRDRQGEPA
ncbi:MAG TPA: amidohydrolase family protein, partial [Myxococcaceae bacterium]|nr:amidohydrolase family protein [Myxococcaceae bacterium]